MDKNKQKTESQTKISKANSIEEIANFWDTHSLADYWDQTYEVEVEMRVKRAQLNVPDQDFLKKREE